MKYSIWGIKRTSVDFPEQWETIIAYYDDITDASNHLQRMITGTTHDWEVDSGGIIYMVQPLNDVEIVDGYRFQMDYEYFTLEEIKVNISTKED